MSSEYDNIKTAKELVSHVMFHGFSTKTEDVCRAQDIFGHSTIEELAFLANDIGRDGKDGNPDPKGTMYSGRRATRGTFYSILFQIWNWEDATRFWNEHTNPEHEKYVALVAEHSELMKAYNDLDSRGAECLQIADDMTKKAGELNGELAKAQYDLLMKENEIMRLKAKLYDLTVGKEE